MMQYILVFKFKPYGHSVNIECEFLLLHQTSKSMPDYLEDHIKLTVIRAVAKECPSDILNFVLKTVDKYWDIESKK